mmetsp:Transcript_23286/g.59852  ORF Transcript_23286/g.59852 Transcript_23286/m.59852 type:complete len:237 (+) Transcript_23286:736-1446(+)
MLPPAMGCGAWPVLLLVAAGLHLTGTPCCHWPALQSPAILQQSGKSTFMHHTISPFPPVATLLAESALTESGAGVAMPPWLALSMTGRLLSELPTITSLALVLMASSCVVSIAFQVRVSGEMPSLTMRWKSAIPPASMRLRSASCRSFWMTYCIRAASCSACAFLSMASVSKVGSTTPFRSTLSTMMPLGLRTLVSSSCSLVCISARPDVYSAEASASLVRPRTALAISGAMRVLT